MPDLHRPLIELSECLCRTVASVTGRDLCWCGLYPGTNPPFEYCGSCSSTMCGVGYVALETVTQYTALAVPGFSDFDCQTPLQALVRVGVLRCFPLEEDGSTSAPEVVESSAIDLMEDMDAIRQAVLCCFQGQSKLVEYRTIGPEGACVGGEWSAYIALEE